MEAPRRLPSGKYQARANVDGVRRSLGTFDTKREAQRAIAGAITHHESGHENVGHERLELFAERFLRTRRHALAHGTWMNYQRMLSKWIIPEFGSRRLRDIRSSDIDRWFASLPATPQRKHIYFLMNSIMRKAVKYGEVAANPCQIERVTAIRSAKRRAWTLSDFAMLVEGAGDVQERALLWTLMGTAARVGEVLALDWEHVDLDRAEITIRRHLTRYGLEEGTKHHRDQERVVSVMGQAVDALGMHRGKSTAMLDAPVFLNSHGARLSYHAAHSRFVALRASLALDEFKLHDIRHLALTHYAQNGPTMRELMERGGHSDHRSALAYQHANRERDREITRAMDSSFTQRPRGA